MFAKSYLLPEEVLLHNQLGDVWVSLCGVVMDVSDIAHPTRSLASKLLFAFAGKDVTHLFDSEATEGDSVTITGRRMSPLIMETDVGELWWREVTRIRGKLTKNPRPIRILDMFTGCEALITVCAEDPLKRVFQRYSLFNSHLNDYICTLAGKPLDLHKTLEENGIKDERELFVDIGLPHDFYIPSILLYLKDCSCLFCIPK